MLLTPIEREVVRFRRAEIENPTKEEKNILYQKTFSYFFIDKNIKKSYNLYRNKKTGVRKYENIK